MKIDDALIDRLAKLSKLTFNDAERDSIKTDLQNMLNFINQINEVDTEGVKPLIHINQNVNNFRADKPIHLNSKAETLSNAPMKNDDFFLVPKVIEK